MADTAPSSGGSCMDKTKSYVKTPKGFILAAEMLLSLIVIICFAASAFGGYSTIAICELIFAAVFFFVFMMELDKTFMVVNWLWSDFFRAVIGAALYLIFSLIGLIRGSDDGASVAGGVFGLIAGVLFAYDTYTIFLKIKSIREGSGPAAV